MPHTAVHIHITPTRAGLRPSERNHRTPRKPACGPEKCTYVDEVDTHPTHEPRPSRHQSLCPTPIMFRRLQPLPVSSMSTSALPVLAMLAEQQRWQRSWPACHGASLAFARHHQPTHTTALSFVSLLDSPLPPDRSNRSPAPCLARIPTACGGEGGV